MPQPLRLQHVTTVIRRASTARIGPGPSTRRPPPRTQYRNANSVQERVPSPNTPPPRYSKSAGRVGRVLTGALGGGIAFYVVVLIVDAVRGATNPVKNPRIGELDQQRDVTSTFDGIAESYDGEVWVSEWLMGINTKRDRLAKMCKGHVLEVSCGTGRNLGYFDIGLDSKVESLTFVDLSPKMVEVCRKKWDVLYAGETKNLKPGLQVRFLASSALDTLPPPPHTSTSTQLGKQKYDTILQTVGLCSTPSPVPLLINLAQHLDISNPDARILLLEHGRSYRDWLNNILDNSAEGHAEKWGCWHNRDIGALVAEAASKAGLEVVRERRWHLGTTYVFELKAVPKQGEDMGKEVKEEENVGSKGGGWFGWR